MRLDMAGANTVDITFLKLTESDAQLQAYGVYQRDHIETLVNAMLPPQSNKIYAVFYEGHNDRTCADAPRPAKPLGNVLVMYLHGLGKTAYPCDGNQWAATQTSMPGYLDMAMLHEIMQALGFVADGAPNEIIGTGHVNNDPRDLMYAGPLP